MQNSHNYRLQPIFGILLIIMGFSIIAAIFNAQGIVLPTDEPAIVFLMLFLISTIIAFGVFLLSGLNPKKFLEPLIICWLWIVFFVLPIPYMPLSRDSIYLLLGFSTFIPLLLWIGYTKLKAKYKRRQNSKSG